MYFHMAEGKRDRWAISVTPKKLLECCSERFKYHTERIAFWNTQRDAAEEKLRTQGIQLKHYEVTGGQRMEAQLDASLAKRVQECESKIKEHDSASKRFLAFKAFLSLVNNSTEPKLDLNVDDVLYFNLEGADRTNKED